mgnify:CR=1 FL=1
MKKKDTFEEILGGILMVVIFLCATFQVLNRFMLHFSAPWTEELCRYAFIWVAFLGVANGVKRGTHLNVDLIDSVLPKKVKAVLDVVLDLAREGKTMIIVTHEMQFARAIADRVLFLEDGKIAEEAAPEEFFTAPKTERAKKFLKTFEFDEVKPHRD